MAPKLAVARGAGNVKCEVVGFMRKLLNGARRRPRASELVHGLATSHAIRVCTSAADDVLSARGGARMAARMRACRPAGPGMPVRVGG